VGAQTQVRLPAGVGSPRWGGVKRPERARALAQAALDAWSMMPRAEGDWEGPDHDRKGSGYQGQITGSWAIEKVGEETGDRKPGTEHGFPDSAFE
jgi:hypothetical protein